MSAQAVSEFIDQLKFKLWAGSDEELAEAIGVGKSTIASWRRRGSVPEKIQRNYYYKYGVDYNLIATGKPCEDAQQSFLFSVALYGALFKIARQIEESEISTIAEWMAQHDTDFRARLVDPLFGGDFGPPDINAYHKLVESVILGDAASLSRFRQLQAEIAAEASAEKER